MSTEEIYFWWFAWLIIGAVIVVAAAGLLIMVIVAARRIAGLATTALAGGEEIEQNTKPIWQLKTSHEVASNLLSGAEAILSNAGAIVGALSKGDKNRAA